MPYEKRHTKKGEIQVVNASSGRVLGTHSSEAKANAQLAALHMNVKDMESNSKNMASRYSSKKHK